MVVSLHKSRILKYITVIKVSLSQSGPILKLSYKSRVVLKLGYLGLDVKNSYKNHITSE